MVLKPVHRPEDVVQHLIRSGVDIVTSSSSLDHDICMPEQEQEQEVHAIFNMMEQEQNANDGAEEEGAEEEGAEEQGAEEQGAEEQGAEEEGE